MSFFATSRRLSAETLYLSLTIGGAARQTGMLDIVEAHRVSNIAQKCIEPKISMDF